MTSSRTKLGVVALIVTAASMLVAVPDASAAYRFHHRDNIDFWTSNRSVHAKGYVNWYVDGLVVRGEYHGAAALHRTGCLYVKVTWHSISGTVSWPPSGSSSAETDGYYRNCGGAGTQVVFGGQARAGRSLYRTCISLGYSSSRSAPRAYQSSHCMSA